SGAQKRMRYLLPAGAGVAGDFGVGLDGGVVDGDVDGVVVDCPVVCAGGLAVVLALCPPHHPPCQPHPKPAMIRMTTIQSQPNPMPAPRGSRGAYGSRGSFRVIEVPHRFQVHGRTCRRCACSLQWPWATRGLGEQVY